MVEDVAAVAAVTTDVVAVMMTMNVAAAMIIINVVAAIVIDGSRWTEEAASLFRVRSLV